MKASALLCFALLSLVFNGCKDSATDVTSALPAYGILGTWQATGQYTNYGSEFFSRVSVTDPHKEWLTFNPDGSMTENFISGMVGHISTTINGRWALTKDNQLAITTTNMDGSQSVTNRKVYNIAGNQLELEALVYAMTK